MLENSLLSEELLAFPGAKFTMNLVSARLLVGWLVVWLFND
jgi:hypothetical protein